MSADTAKDFLSEGAKAALAGLKSGSSWAVPQIR